MSFIESKSPREIGHIFERSSADTLSVFALGQNLVRRVTKRGERDMTRAGLYLGKAASEVMTVVEISNIEPDLDMLGVVLGYGLSESVRHDPQSWMSGRMSGALTLLEHDALAPLRDMTDIRLITCRAGFDDSVDFDRWQQDVMTKIRPSVANFPEDLIPLVEVETPWIRQLGDER